MSAMTDRYTPLLQAFPAAVSPVPRDCDWRNGLLVRSTNWLGDALMTLPAVAQMRRALPAGRRLAVLTPRGLAPVWAACPFVDDVIPMADKHLTQQEVADIRRLDLGVAIVLPNSFGSALDIWKTRIPVRAGRRGRWRRLLLTHTLPEWPRGENVGVCHQLSYYLQLATLLCPVELSASCPPLSVDASLAEPLGVVGDGPWLALAPGAAYGPAKQWPAANFAAVARWHLRERGPVVILGGKKELPAAQAIVDELGDGAAGLLNLAGQTDLRQLMAVLAHADWVVANDSGAMHLAAGLGRRGVAVFGSTDPVATGPIGGEWRLLVAETPCRPCFRRECPRPADEAYACLKSITPQQVIERLAD